MDQPVLTGLFVVEVEKLPEVPIAPSASIQARHCSAMGAQTIKPTRETLWRHMVVLYRVKPRTDAEIAEIVSWVFNRRISPSTISARRSELMKLGTVEDKHDTRKNPHTGVSNSLWGLTEKGRQG